MTRTATLTLDFTSYWLAGTGAKGGRAFDDVAHRDRWGCPALPMSQVKGVLRDSAHALANADAAGWSHAQIDDLFGKPAQAGALRFVGEARLPAEARAWFAHKANRAARANLFRRVPATRIDANGIASDHSLRAVEVAVPLTLTAQIEGPADDVAWVARVDSACAATLALGKLRNDGYGRVLARLA